MCWDIHLVCGRVGETHLAVGKYLYEISFGLTHVGEHIICLGRHTWGAHVCGGGIKAVAALSAALSVTDGIIEVSGVSKQCQRCVRAV